jgi:hypothetical protein
MIRLFSLSCGLCLVAVTGATLLAGDDARRNLEQAQFVSEGTFRGFALPGVAALQHEKALADWKKLYAKDKPAHLETDRFLLYGADAKNLPEAGALLDKTYDLAAKTLDMEGVKAWSGKLAVFMVGDRGEFTSLVRILQKRRAEEDEQGAFDVDDEINPHVVAGPSAGLSPEQQAAAQVGAALLVRKAGRNVPHWVQVGFGRATALRAGPTKDLAAEHRRVASAIKGKRTIKEVLGRSLADLEETALLQASLMEYLAYSGRTAKFMPFVKGFQPDEAGTEPKVEAVLESLMMPADKLNAVWKKWAETAK